MPKRKEMAAPHRRLIDDVATEMLEYLPEGNYRYIGGVNRQFRDAHGQLHRNHKTTSTSTTLEESVRSFERAMILLKEYDEHDRYFPFSCVAEALRCGNVEFLTWLSLILYKRTPTKMFSLSISRL